MRKAVFYSIIVVVVASFGIFNTKAQLPPNSAPTEPLTVVIDSVKGPIGYVLVTVMSEDFRPIDYAMRPAQPPTMAFQMKKPANGVPFSVMAFHDINGDYHLNLNENKIPEEPSSVVHLSGTENNVTVKLRDMVSVLKQIEKNKSEKNAQDSISTK